MTLTVDFSLSESRSQGPSLFYVRSDEKDNTQGLAVIPLSPRLLNGQEPTEKRINVLKDRIAWAFDFARHQLPENASFKAVSIQACANLDPSTAVRTRSALTI